MSTAQETVTPVAEKSSSRANGSRTRARRRALEILFEAGERGVSAAAIADKRLIGDEDTPSISYASVLVHGVAERLGELDEWLSSYSQGWTLERMPRVDRAILRLGAWEIVYADDVPDEVTLKDMADLAGEFSTESSPTFVSGLLGTISRLKGSLR